MRKNSHKNRAQSGETLVETLVAVLISALSMVMLAATIASTSHMITTSTDKLSRYCEENNKLVDSPEGGSSAVTVKLEVEFGSSKATRTYSEKRITLRENPESGNIKVTAYGVTS